MLASNFAAFRFLHETSRSSAKSFWLRRQPRRLSSIRRSLEPSDGSRRPPSAYFPPFLSSLLRPPTPLRRTAKSRVFVRVRFFSSSLGPRPEHSIFRKAGFSGFPLELVSSLELVALARLEVTYWKRKKALVWHTSVPGGDKLLVPGAGMMNLENSHFIWPSSPAFDDVLSVPQTPVAPPSIPQTPCLHSVPQTPSDTFFECGSSPAPTSIFFAGKSHALNCFVRSAWLSREAGCAYAPSVRCSERS